MHPSITRFATLLMLAGLSFSASAQITYYIKSNTAGTGSANSWSNASSDLYHVLSLLHTGDQVWIAAGVYIPSSTDTTLSFNIPNGAKLYGGFAGGETKLSDRNIINNQTLLCGALANGAHSYHVIRFKNATEATTLDGFFITQGGKASIGTYHFPDQVGGGVFNDASGNGTSNPTIINCTFNDNHEIGYGSGAALYNYASGPLSVANPKLINCTISGNSAALGGGGMVNEAHDSSTASPTLTNCIISNNSSQGLGGGVFSQATNTGTAAPKLINCTITANTSTDDGAGMYNATQNGATSNPTLTNCIITNNITQARGGGIFNDGSLEDTSTATLINCIISGNTAQTFGGGVYNDGSSSGVSNSTLTNCLITGNKVIKSGGGVCNDGSKTGTSKPIYTNCTISGNSAALSGGAIYNDASTNGKCTPNIQNSILWGDQGEVTENSASLTIFNHSILQGSQTTDPLFLMPVNFAAAPNTNGDYHLKPTSPAIGAGDIQFTTIGETDLDGTPRTSNGKVDIGAYQHKTIINVQEIAHSLNIAIFPNPFSQSINIDFRNLTQPLTPSDEIIITNLTGQEIFRQKSTPTLMTIPTENWTNGLYLLNIQIGEKRLTFAKAIK